MLLLGSTCDIHLSRSDNKLFAAFLSKDFISSNGTNLDKKIDSVVDDSEGFIKLGLLARVLQVLLGKIGIPDIDPEFAVFESSVADQT